MAKGRLSPIVVSLAVVLSAAALAAGRPDPSTATQLASGSRHLDELIQAKLTHAGLHAAAPASDAVFLRRAYIDVIGTLPTADEAKAFLADESPSRRSALVDRLLDRAEFADYWAMKWSEVLRVKSEFPINLWPNAVQAYHHWIRASLRDDLPYDRFARELLTESGSNFRVPPVNFYRAVQSREPQALASAVALTFMGARTERWSKDDLADLAVFFSQVAYKTTDEWKEEIVFFDPDKPRPGASPGAPFMARLPDGSHVKVSPGQDPREVFATWLTSPSNPYFARTAVNRIWYWLVGRGLVEEPDDMRQDNPPSHPELLAFLSQELVASHYDLRHIYRIILNSATYQQSATPAAPAPSAAEPSSAAGSAEDDSTFAHYLVRPLDAEVLMDALCQITGIGEAYQSAIPEPYTFMPDGQRAVALADGSITNAFLEEFGRPPRDTGLASERGSRATAAQRLDLLNSSIVQRKLEQSPKLQALLQSARDGRQLATALYLTILSRVPTDAELQAASSYAQTTTNRRLAAIDLAWALINSEEFLYRH